MNWAVSGVALLCLILFLPGCATIAYRVQSPTITHGKHVHYLEKVPPIAQKAYQCGPAALSSVIPYWGETADANAIARAIQKPGVRGTLNFSLSQYARNLGFWTDIAGFDQENLGMKDLKLWIHRRVPPIALLSTSVLWVPNYHFVVLKGFNDNYRIFYANVGEPETYAIGYQEFERRWKGAGYWRLIICPPGRVAWNLDENQAADLALFSERQGRLDLAQKWYRNALDKNPGNEKLRFNLANVYLKTKQFTEAKEIYQKLLKEKPAWGAVGNNLAWVYLQENHPREAADVIETAFRNGAGRHSDILDTAGMVYQTLKETHKAQEYFLEALNEVSENDVSTRQLINGHMTA